MKNYETKIVSAPQTELDKPLKMNIVGNKKEIKKARNKAISAMRSKTKKERMKEREKRNEGSLQDLQMEQTHWTCSQCGVNATWLDYPICYQCYVKNGKKIFPI